jgi:hypothetical protein
METTTLMMLLVGYVLCILGIGKMAQKKNRSWFIWTMVAWFFTPVVAFIFLRDQPVLRRKPHSDVLNYVCK